MKSLRRIWAGALLGMRAPLRSRFVAALVILLAAAVLVLPVQIRTDGSTAAELRMLLTWTLGTALTLLSVATLWAGCAGISSDMEEKRHVLTAISPARPFEIFTGRWLGLVLLDIVLLAAVLIGIFVQLRVRGLSADDTRVQRLLPRDPAALQEEADRLFREIFPDGTPDPTRAGPVRASIERDLGSRLHVPVEPGMERRWRFPVPETWRDDPAKAPPLTGVFQYLSTYGSTQPLRGVLECRDGEGTLLLSRPLEDDRGRVDFTLPAGAWAAQESVTVIFRNTEPPGEGVAALIRYDDAVRLYVPGGGLAANLARAGLSMLALLSLLAALGIACGCALSFPVAAFAATAMCLVALVAQNEFYTDPVGTTPHAHDHGEAVEPSAFSQGLETVSRGMTSVANGILAPLHGSHALDRLGDGIRVETAAGVRALVLDGILLPLVLGLGASLVLARRDL